MYKEKALPHQSSRIPHDLRCYNCEALINQQTASLLIAICRLAVLLDFVKENADSADKIAF